jgi:hypothetical protein
MDQSSTVPPMILQQVTHFCFIDVVIIPRVWSPDSHDGEVLVAIQAVIADGRLKKMSILR